MTIGNNGGPPDTPFTYKTKLECINGILERTDLTAAQKCVGIKIVVESDKEWGAEVNTETLRTAASVKDRETVFRATRTLDQIGIISKSSTRGQTGHYTVLPPRIVSSIIDAYEDLKSSRVEPDQSAANQSAQTGRLSPDQSGQTSPVSPDQSAQTGRVEPDQSSRARVSNNINIYNNNNSLLEQVNNNYNKLGQIRENLFDLPTEKNAEKKPSRLELDFAEFWKVYPRKIAKKGAEAAYQKARKSGVDAERILAGAKRYVASRPNPQFIPHPTSWLNQGRYDDEGDAVLGATAATAVPEPVEGSVGPNGRAWGWWRKYDEILSPEASVRAIERFRPNGTWPWWELGAPPGHPECIIHPSVLEMRGLVEIYKGKTTHE